MSPTQDWITASPKSSMTITITKPEFRLRTKITNNTPSQAKERSFKTG